MMKKLVVCIGCKNPDQSIPNFLQRHLHLSTRPPKQCMFYPFHLIIPILIIDSHSLIESLTQGHLVIALAIDLELILEVPRLYHTKAKFLVLIQPLVSHDDDITYHSRSVSHWEIMAQICWSCTGCADKIKHTHTHVNISKNSWTQLKQESPTILHNGICQY